MDPRAVHSKAHDGLEFLTAFLDEVSVPANPRYRPTATLTKDPLYRSVLALRR